MTPREPKYIMSLMESIVVNSTKKLYRVIEALKMSGRYVVYECIYNDYKGNSHFRVYYWRKKLC